MSIAVAETPDSAPTMEPGLAVACRCHACRYPTPANLETRLLHAERHAEYKRRYGSEPTPRELAMWTILRDLRDHEASAETHYGSCKREGECKTKPAHPEGHA